MILPYYLILVVSLLSQTPLIKSIPIQFGLDYPTNITGLGYIVNGEQDYASIKLFSHPAPIILFATLITYLIYKTKNIWSKDIGITALKRTYSQCVPSSLGLITMVMMSLIMIDSGMTSLLGNSILQSRKSRYIKRTFVSTDSKKIAQEAKKNKAEVPFIRPAELSNDYIGTTIYFKTS